LDNVKPNLSSGSFARRRRIDDHMVLVKDEIVRGHVEYVVEKVVGSGAYACVYKARDEMGRIVALKEYFPAAHPKDAAQLRILWEREKYVLTQVSPHPLMPSFYDAFDFNKQLYIAQEFVEGATLADLIYRYKRLDPSWMLRWAVNLCDALTYLHERCIVHHDLKPANLKITPEGHLYVLDYGAAQYFGEKHEDTPDALFAEGELYGTEGYLPPEVEETFVANVQTDIFALGCILYEMVMGVPPEQRRLNERNTAVTTPLTQRQDVDLEYVKLVSTALSYNSEYRYASAQNFLSEIRKIAPPVPMVSHKNIYFGTIDYKHAERSETFLIYNNGPQVDLTGYIVAKAPWIKIDVPRFKAKRRPVMVVCDPSHATVFNQPIKTDIEISVDEIRDHDGAIVSRADKWIVHCFAYIKARAPRMEMTVDSSSKTPIEMSSMKGMTAKLKLNLANTGEVPADFILEPADPSLGLVITPNRIRLGEGESIKAELQYTPPKSSAAATVVTSISANIGKVENASIPVTLRTVSAVEYAKKALGFKK
jgi:serine/threonine protein kinase